MVSSAIYGYYPIDVTWKTGIIDRGPMDIGVRFFVGEDDRPLTLGEDDPPAFIVDIEGVGSALIPAKYLIPIDDDDDAIEAERSLMDRVRDKYPITIP